MALPDPASDPARQRLAALRETLLTLHKALLDSERTSYEISHGPIGSPAVFLHLLINNTWLAWLRPVPTLLAKIDKTLAGKNPPATSHDFELLIEDIRA